MLKISALVLIGILAILAALYVAGLMIPQEHTVRLERTIPNHTPSSLQALILQVDKYPQWRKDLKSVELIAANPLRYRETTGHGQITFELTSPGESEFQIRIADESLPFGGTWRLGIFKVPTGTKVAIVESGIVKSPFYRVISKFVIGYERSISNYLDALEAHGVANGTEKP